MSGGKAHQRMWGGKASGKQAAEYTGNQPGVGSFVTSRRETAAAERDFHAPGHTHRKSMLLKESLKTSASEQKGGNRERQADCCAEEEVAHYE